MQTLSKNSKEMMSKKKAMGIPSLEILKEKTKDFNLQPDASVVPNEKSEEHTTIKTVKIEKEDENTQTLLTPLFLIALCEPAAL